MSRAVFVTLVGALTSQGCTSATSIIVDRERETLVTRLDPALLGTPRIKGASLDVLMLDGQQVELNDVELERSLSLLNIKSASGETVLQLADVAQLELAEEFSGVRKTEASNTNYNLAWFCGAVFIFVPLIALVSAQ